MANLQKFEFAFRYKSNMKSIFQAVLLFFFFAIYAPGTAQVLFLEDYFKGGLTTGEWTTLASDSTIPVK